MQFNSRFFCFELCFAVVAQSQDNNDAPKLPAGMTGSNADDPRAKLSPGLFDAGEAAFGMKHLLLLKKPDAFQLGTNDADDPKVQKTLGSIGIGDTSQIPKDQQLVISSTRIRQFRSGVSGQPSVYGQFLRRKYLRHLESGTD